MCKGDAREFREQGARGVAGGAATNGRGQRRINCDVDEYVGIRARNDSKSWLASPDVCLPDLAAFFTECDLSLDIFWKIILPPASSLNHHYVQNVSKCEHVGEK